MEEGDFVVTPPGAWHDHGNPSDRPMIWLDGLDIPMVQFFDASFFERHPQEEQPLTREPGDSLARYGANMLPVDFDDRRPVSPIFSYPYARSREALERMRRQDEWDPCHGLKLRYIDPKSGDFAMPTIAPFLQLLPKGFRTARYRSTDATVFTPVEGHGRSVIDGQAFEWGPRDIFVVPSWRTVRHEADIATRHNRGHDDVIHPWADDDVLQRRHRFHRTRIHDLPDDEDRTPRNRGGRCRHRCQVDPVIDRARVEQDGSG